MRANRNPKPRTQSTIPGKTETRALVETLRQRAADGEIDAIAALADIGIRARIQKHIMGGIR